MNGLQKKLQKSRLFITNVLGRYDQLSAHGGSCSKSIEISDSSILVSSLAKDLSQSPSQSSFRDEAESYSFVDSHTSQTDDKTAQTVRTINFSNTPKHSPRKIRNKRSVQGTSFADLLL